MTKSFTLNIIIRVKLLIFAIIVLDFENYNLIDFVSFASNLLEFINIMVGFMKGNDISMIIVAEGIGHVYGGKPIGKVI